jgi:predicted PurR-regulated permease PerM
MKIEAKISTSKDNSFGTTSVISAMISIVLSLFSPLLWAALALAIVGLVFSFKQKKVSQNKWSKWGMILSIVGIILFVLGLVLNRWLLNNYPNLLGQM